MSLLFSECKKYDEVPTLSIRSKQHRMEGEWDVTSYTEDGKNMLNYSITEYLPCPSGSETYMHRYEQEITGFYWTFEKGAWNYHYNYSDEEENTGCMQSGPFYGSSTESAAGT